MKDCPSIDTFEISWSSRIPFFCLNMLRYRSEGLSANVWVTKITKGNMCETTKSSTEHPRLLRTHPAARCETSHRPSLAMWFWRLRMDSAIWSWGSGRCAWSFHHGWRCGRGGPRRDFLYLGAMFQSPDIQLPSDLLLSQRPLCTSTWEQLLPPPFSSVSPMQPRFVW